LRRGARGRINDKYICIIKGLRCLQYFKEAELGQAKEINMVSGES